MGEEMRWRGRPDGEGHCNPGIMIWDFTVNTMDESSQEDFLSKGVT